MLGRRNQASVSALFFAGVMSELIHYNRALTAAERQRIDSYLAIKYGIPLDQVPPANNYIDSTGAIVSDATANAAHKTTSRISAATMRAA
jgi:phage gp36-like protein